MSFRPEQQPVPDAGNARLEHLIAQSRQQQHQYERSTPTTSVSMEPQEPAQPFEPFSPEYPSPKAVPDVVGSLFGDIETDDTAGLLSGLKAAGKSALANAKKATDKLTLKNAKAAMEKVKSAGKSALSKAKSGVSALSKKVADMNANIGNFDYSIQTADTTVVGTIKKKGTEVKPKHQILPFPSADWSGSKIFDLYQKQQGSMFKVSTKTRSTKKGGEKVSNETEKREKGVHVLCMGFTDVSNYEDDPVSNIGALEALLYNKDAAVKAGATTLVSTKATFEGTSLMCVTGLLVEAIDAGELYQEDGVIPYKFAAVPEEPTIGAEDGEINADNIADTYVSTIRGIHVTEDKEVVLGPKIYIPRTREAMSNIAAYGYAEEGVGVVRALNKATKAEGIDLRMLWSAMHFARGIQDLYSSKVTPAATKKSLGPLFGALDGITNQNSFSMSVEEMAHFGMSLDDDDDDDDGFRLNDDVF